MFFPQRLVPASGNCPVYNTYWYVFFLWEMLDARADYQKCRQEKELEKVKKWWHV